MSLFEEIIDAINCMDGEHTRIVDAVGNVLTESGVNFHAYAINRMTGDGSSFLILTPGGNREIGIIAQTPRLDHLRDKIDNEEIWYRPDLALDDPLGERRVFSPATCVVDVPFSDGSLSVKSQTPDSFSNEQIELFRDIAGLVQLAFDKSDRLKFRQIEADLITKLAKSQDPFYCLDTVARSLVEAKLFRSMTVSQVDHRRGIVSVVVNYFWNNVTDTLSQREDVDRATYDLNDDNITAEAARSSEPIVIRGQHEKFDKRFNKVSDKGKISYFIPIAYDDITYAVLATGSTPRDEPRVTKLIEELGLVREHLAISMRNQILLNERKQAEDALRESENLLSLILETTQDGILVGHSDGSFSYANKRFAEMWRIPQEAIDTRDRTVLQHAVQTQLKDPEGFLARFIVHDKT